MGENRNTLFEKRLRSILSYLDDRYGITIRETAELNGTSEATARRDLDEMASRKLIVRTHGGAVLPSSHHAELSQDDKLHKMTDEKTRIAERALELVHDGMTLFLDSGTTVLTLARRLAEFKNLTIMTTNTDVLSVPMDPSTAVVMTGGVFRREYRALAGDLAEAFIRGIHVEMAFIGIDAIYPEEGVFNDNIVELGTKKAILQCADRCVALTDHTKLQKKSLVRICALKDIDTLIIDQGADEKDLERIHKEIGDIRLV